MLKTIISGIAFLVATVLASAAPAFPLEASPNGRHLVDASGTPFFLHGDTAWSLIAQLDEEEASQYLADRASRGFTAILVNLIEHQFSANPPANRYGDHPFLSPGDFATPNPSYFDHADSVLEKAERHGLCVLLCPAYLGYKGRDEGFFKQQHSGTREAMRAYGAFLGQRFSKRKNILWVLGGDFTPPPEQRWVIDQLAAGIRQHDLDRLMTYHGQRDDIPRRDFPNADWLTLNHVYTRAPALPQKCRREFTRTPALPTILIESAYENEHDTPRHQLRAQAYESLLSGCCGHVFGNNPVWHFGSSPDWHQGGTDWSDALDSPGARDMQHLAAIFQTIPWWTLIPDTKKSRPEFSIAMTTDRTTALAYVPHSSSETTTLTFDLSQLAGPLDAQWIDPSNNARIAVEKNLISNEKAQTFRTPGKNSAGDRDWLLLLAPRRPTKKD